MSHDAFDESSDEAASADAQPSYVEVDASHLAPGTLDRLVEEFVTRDGTDYGHVERSLEEKAADILRQIDSGEVRIVFDPETESVQLVVARELSAS